ncbi:unnamed protein product [Absidia cylindrospora]
MKPPNSTSLPENCALASPKDNAYFHALFKSVPDHDCLLEIYKCALHRDILLQGHLYLSENYVCFHANIFGWITNLVIEYNEIILIERKMTAMIIPNGIQINTQHAKHTFASFIFREAAYQQLMSLWAIHKPQQLESAALEDGWSTTSDENSDDDCSTDTDATISDDDSLSTASPGSSERIHHRHHHHHHHHHNKDHQQHLSIFSSWKSIVVLLLLLHSAWMIRKWARLGNQLEQQQQQQQQSNLYDGLFDSSYEPLLPHAYFEKSHNHHIYSRLDHLRQRMESLNQQILNQQSQLYDLSPPQES